MQQAQFEEQRQKEANETALAAIGKPKKRKLEESTNHPHPTAVISNGLEQISTQPSPSTGAANTTNAYQKSVLEMIKIQEKLKNNLIFVFYRDLLNVYVEQIFVIY